jgi:hypothetical protein
MWEPEPSSSASGGHIAPDVGATGPLYDPRVPSEERPPPFGSPAAPQAERSEMFPPAGLPAEPDQSSRQPRARTRRRPATRRVKRVIRHVDPFSVLKLSLFYYACFLVIWLLFAAVVYFILNAVGLFDTVNKIARGFAFNTNFHVTLFFIERWAFLIGLPLLVIASIVNVFLAFLYNFAADTVGGLELIFVERDS